MNKAELVELIKEVMKEEQDYQALFKHMLDRTGKSISSMSDDIDNLVKMNEIRDVIQVEIVEE